MLSTTQPFNVPQEPPNFVFVKNKLGDYQDRRNNILLEEAQPNPYVSVVVVLEKALREGTATDLTKPHRASPRLTSIDRSRATNVGGHANDARGGNSTASRHAIAYGELAYPQDCPGQFHWMWLPVRQCLDRAYNLHSHC